MQMPDVLKRLMNVFREFPGIGEKSAERFIFWLLENSCVIDSLIQSLTQTKENLIFCSECFIPSDKPLCEICGNPERDGKSLTVVSSPKEAYTIEKLGIYKGKYFVLKGLLSPLEEKGPEAIRIPELLQRIKNNSVLEVIFALPPTTEGEATIFYIYEKLQNIARIKSTKLARGIPAGTSVEFIDPLTLREAFLDRKPVKGGASIA